MLVRGGNCVGDCTFLLVPVPTSISMVISLVNTINIVNSLTRCTDNASIRQNFIAQFKIYKICELKPFNEFLVMSKVPVGIEGQSISSRFEESWNTFNSK